MILTHSVKVCLATQPCDLRKSFDTLSALVEQELHEDPLCSKLFVFLNKKCDRVKLLYWDQTGLWVMAKRLERGCFKRPIPSDRSKPKLNLRPEALEMLLSGIDLKDGTQRGWYQDS